MAIATIAYYFIIRLDLFFERQRPVDIIKVQFSAQLLHRKSKLMTEIMWSVITVIFYQENAMTLFS